LIPLKLLAAKRALRYQKWRTIYEIKLGSSHFLPLLTLAPFGVAKAKGSKSNRIHAEGFVVCYLQYPNELNGIFKMIHNNTAADT
jgi:hypothetical protein